MTVPPCLLVFATVVCVCSGRTTSAPNVTTTTKPPLTGDPQKDYIYDPNLPFQLRGYNLSDYPFYKRIPNDITFKCDGLKDGFYASKPHMCQVYHHCLFGVRYDFLCANYTAFDQQNFICHFVSEVDCENSDKYWGRNDALYQEKSTTTTTTAGPPERVRVAVENDRPFRRRRPGRRRPYRRRRPYYDDYYYDDYYYRDYDQDYDYYDYGNRKRKGGRRPSVEPVVSRDPKDSSRKSLFSRSRPKPLVNPPVPRPKKPAVEATSPKSNLNDIPFGADPIPIDENLVKEPEGKQSPLPYYDEYTEEPLQLRQTISTEKIIQHYRPNRRNRYRPNTARKAVLTTTPPPPPSTTEKRAEYDYEYEDYMDPIPPRRKNPRRPGGFRRGFRRRRPFRRRPLPLEPDYPDTESAASFTEEDPSIQRPRINSRPRVPQYQEEPYEQPPPRKPAPPPVVPPRRLISQKTHSSPKSSPTSARDRFPSRRRPSVDYTEEPIKEYTEKSVVQYEQQPVSQYEQEPVIEYQQEPVEQLPPPSRRHIVHQNTRGFTSRRRTPFYRQEQPSTPQEYTENIKQPVQQKPTSPPKKKKGTPIRIEDIVFHEVGPGLIPRAFVPTTSKPPQNIPRYTTTTTTAKPEPMSLDNMPLDELSKFTPAINKKPPSPPYKPQSTSYGPTLDTERPYRQYYNPRRRQPSRVEQQQPVQHNTEGQLDFPVPQVPRSRSQFPEAALFNQQPTSERTVTSTPLASRRNEDAPTHRRRGSFRLRIPVRASRRLVRGLFPHMKGL